MPTNNNAMSDAEAQTGPAASSCRVRSRRGFVGAAAGGLGVLLSVQARTALGQMSCQTPSAAVSGNQSGPPTNPTCTGGASPTVWKLQDSIKDWPLGMAPSFNKPLTDSTSSCFNGQAISNPKSVLNANGNGKLVSDILLGAPTNTGIWEIMAFPGNFTNGDLMSHLIAAWLNATVSQTYPIRQSHVQELWEGVKDGGTYCPASIACTATMGMNRDQVISFIQQTYTLDSAKIFVCKVA